MSDRTDGQTQKDAGKLEEAVGHAAGSDTLAERGRVDQAAGAVKEGLHDAQRDVNNAVSEARDALDS